MGTLRTSLSFLLYLLSSFYGVHSVKYLVTFPSKPHYDAEYLVTVSAVGVPEGGREYVTLKYTGSLDTSRQLKRTDLEFTEDGMQTWGVTFSWQRMQELRETGVKFSINNTRLSKEKVLEFHKDAGYIFIQTDKPIYSPRQTVRFRIIAVDENQVLAKSQVKVDIKNPERIIVDRMRYSAEEAFKGQEFVLPREASTGNWLISANFEGPDNAQSSTKEVKFEVKEYVLPRFSADLSISTSVVTRDTEWISFDVTAKYVYGRSVNGSAEIQLGVWDPYDGVRLLPTKYFGKLESDGTLHKDVRISKVFPRDEEFPKDKRLYIAVNVTEEATGENDTIVDTSTFIAHPYYEVDYSSSDKYFKPGFTYTLKADIRAKSGKPAPWVPLYVRYQFKNSQRRTIGRKSGYHPLDASARMIKNIDVPADAHKIQVQILVLDYARSSIAKYLHTVNRYQSLTNEYIKVALTSPIKYRRDGNLLLRYTRSDPNIVQLGSGRSTKITVQILARGVVVFTATTVKNTDGRSNVKLPRRLFREVSPSMRIVAYYHATAGQISEYIVDSLLVDTLDVCLEDVTIRRPGGSFASQVPYKPKESYNMAVRGGSRMKVGFVAVDEAVFLLNNKQTLTRESFFEQMGSHDQGKGEGNGKDFKEIIQNSGMHFLEFDSEEETEEASFDRIHEMIPFPDVFNTLNGGRVGPSGLPGYPDYNFRSASGIGLRAHKEPPPQTIRKYFPEAWMFEEMELPQNGRMNLNVTLPDSITTWNFMAVGVSSRRGVCVSKPLRQEVQKLFFADIRLPYKVTRLEQVKVRIAIYNYQSYPIEVSVVVSGQSGLCFSSNSDRGSTQHSHSFKLRVDARGVASSIVKVIPLKNGDLPIRVDLISQNDRDVVERNLYVVAEGLRVRKSITFVLDPEAKHVQQHRALGSSKLVFQNTASIVNNIFDLQKKMQSTIIDLALPEEVISGTEYCGISAFGDLMGDIITHAIVQSKSLVDQPVADAEEVLGDLGPTVHALLYINQSGIADEAIAEKGRRFISHSVARLLKYHEISFFKLTPKSKPATWLTAVVLKTLCHSSKLAYVDKKTLIDLGFTWLARQMNPSQSLNIGRFDEKDWRLSKNTTDYSMVLSAEVMIAAIECDRVYMDMDEEPQNHFTDEYLTSIRFYLMSNMFMTNDPMVLAKASYAMWLYDSIYSSAPGGESSSGGAGLWRDFARQLWSMHKTNEHGQFYWSKDGDEEDRHVNFWYKSGAKAHSIETTAYALMVLLEWDPNLNVDPIADWLVGQRNDKGAFIGAMDSMAAIQALSKYSQRKHPELGVDLSCNVSSDKPTATEYMHSFKFTPQNATSPGSINNVPVGHKLEVQTQGQGLGQMQVNVEYNVPVDKNARCPFNVTVNVKGTNIQWSQDMNSNPLCTTCGIGCNGDNNDGSDDEDDDNVEEEEEEEEAEQEPMVLSDFTSTRVSRVGSRRRTSSPRVESVFSRRVRGPPGPTRQMNRAGRRGSRRSRNRRGRRSLRNVITASKRAICIHVCLRNLKDEASGPVIVEFEMLSGYHPVLSDVNRIREREDVRYIEFVSAREMLIVQFNDISASKKRCFGLRATDEMEVGRPAPATVQIKIPGDAQPACVTEYNPPLGEESLQVFCADSSNTNRGECRCFSGICSSCVPLPIETSMVQYDEVLKMTCSSPVVYGIHLNSVTDKNHWVTIDATVLSLNRTGNHMIETGDNITLITPSSCYCPHFSFKPGTQSEGFGVYLLTPDVERLVDRKGDHVYRYLLDDKSKFLRVSPPPHITQESTSDHPTVPFMFLKSAVSFELNDC